MEEDKLFTERVVLELLGGADLYITIKQATIIAFKENRIVEFEHSNTNYIIDPASVVMAIREMNKQ